MKIHSHENNPESQEHLDKNRKKFSRQCLKVMELMLQGKRLTTINAASYGILSLPRRIKDLKENGVFVDEQWIKPNGSTVEIKEWFIAPKTGKEKKELQDFLKELQSEEPSSIPTQTHTQGQFHF